ncbi:MAG: exopolysaccharide biosynthesis polyprenyl glycosylphosphotransferase [Acetobacteraceae bacterium]|nr:exopolysaccharide biosynthesis polyprenyl glycosylphosphotransferase [Acetobacteraceae bacterium]
MSGQTPPIPTAATEFPARPAAWDLSGPARGLAEPHDDAAPRKLPAAALQVLAAALDAVGAALLSALIFLAYGSQRDYPAEQLYVGLVFFCLAWALAAQAQGLYRSETVLLGREQLRPALRTNLYAFGALLLAAFGAQLIGGFSRIWLLSWALATVFWTLGWRVLWDGQLRRLLAGGYCIERVLVVAPTEARALALGGGLQTDTVGRLRAVAALSLDDAMAGAALTLAQERLVDRVMIQGLNHDPAAVNGLVGVLSRFSVPVSLMPDLDALEMPPLHAARIGGRITFEMVTRPLTDAQAAMKRAEDVVISTLALLALAPLMLVIAVAIKLDSPGPVFFRQKRVGFHDRAFRVWKFRTMYHESGDQIGLRQTSRDDPRVTRVGRLLRRSSADELPQLFNVMAGDMALVGPRPHAIAMTTAGRPLSAVVEEYAARHRIKPGITGWAQVNGCRGEVHTEDQLRARVEHDLFYISNWSLGLDIWILTKTAILVLFDRRAY